MTNTWWWPLAFQGVCPCMYHICSHVHTHIEREKVCFSSPYISTSSLTKEMDIINLWLCLGFSMVPDLFQKSGLKGEEKPEAYGQHSWLPEKTLDTRASQTILLCGTVRELRTQSTSHTVQGAHYYGPKGVQLEHPKHIWCRISSCTT